jgi:alpha-glucosidase (family GH31 glycosyl hydrolase)
MLRPLLVDFPDDPFAWRVDLQYLLGPSLLVAPLFDEGEERQVYLPAGEWWDWWEDRMWQGPRMLRVAAPLARVPLFVRGGSVLPLAPAMQHTAAAAWDPILLEVRGLATTSLRIPDGDVTLEARVVAHGTHLLVELAPCSRTVAIRLCGHDGLPRARIERGAATWTAAEDERGRVLAVSAPAGARLRLACAV